MAQILSTLPGHGRKTPFYLVKATDPGVSCAAVCLVISLTPPLPVAMAPFKLDDLL